MNLERGRATFSPDLIDRVARVDGSTRNAGLVPLV
jgi:hypothetical protein